MVYEPARGYRPNALVHEQRPELLLEQFKIEAAFAPKGMSRLWTGWVVGAILIARRVLSMSS